MPYLFIYTIYIPCIAERKYILYIIKKEININESARFEKLI